MPGPSPSVSQGGPSRNLTSTAVVTGQPAILLGFYVNSTSSGTIVFRDGGAGGTVLNGTITPAIGWHCFPSACPNGIHATIGGTLDVTIFYQPGGN